MRKGRKREKIADSPLSRRLLSELQKGNGIDYNIGKLVEHGMPRQVVNSWINGRRQPKIDSLKKVADILGFDVYIFFKDAEKEMIPDQEEVCELVKRVKDKEALDAAKTLLRMAIISKRPAPQ